MAEPAINKRACAGRSSFFNKSLSISAIGLFAAITLVSASGAALNYFLIEREATDSTAAEQQQAIARKHLATLVGLQKKIANDALGTQQYLFDDLRAHAQDVREAEDFAKGISSDIAAAKDVTQAVGGAEAAEAHAQLAVRLPDLYQRAREMAKTYAASDAANEFAKGLPRMSDEVQAEVALTYKTLEAAMRVQEEKIRAENEKIDNFRGLASKLSILNIFGVTLTCLLSVFIVRRWFVQPLNKLDRESHLLTELSEWLQCCKSLDELYGMVAKFLTALLPDCAGSLYVYTSSRDVLDCVKVWNGATQTPSIQPDDCWSLRRGRGFTHGKSDIEFHCAHVGASNAVEYCCIPILAHGETIGMLHLELRADRALGDEKSRKDMLDDQRRLGAACAEQISMAIANVKLRDQLRDQAVRDPLTGLFNRRYLLETMRREISRAKRMGQSVSVLLLDVDHFKKFNDSHGHDAGDCVLRAVSECLETGFRNEDFACRFGGEEFLVVLVGASPAIAFRRAEQLRGKIESTVVRHLDRNLPRVTASIGVAAFPDCGDNPEAIISAADEALYVAKQTGRNRVELANFSEKIVAAEQGLETDAGGLQRLLQASFDHGPTADDSGGIEIGCALSA
jgi:diguanylate cyclase (GGDEF)-like protein